MNAKPTLFPDYKYDIRFDSDFQDRDDGFACRLAPVFLLHLFDGQKSRSDVITDYFLVLKKSNHLGRISYSRIALFNLAFHNWSERQKWFEGEYECRIEAETLVVVE